MHFLGRERAYLDNAAALPVRPRALRAFHRAVRAFGNPSAPHQEGRVALSILEDARARIAREVGAKADAVIFTSGATEANALAIIGHIRARMREGTPARHLHALYLPTQHSSVIGAMRALSALGVAVEEVPLAEGKISLALLRERIRPETALISLDVVCGETGTRHDTRAVRALLDEARGPGEPRIILHADATQAPLVENMERTRFGADLLSFDAQKIGGVRGIGALIAPRAVPVAPLAEGGGQERGMRPGTPAPALAAAFAVALAECARERAGFASRASRMKERLANAVLSGISATVRNGSPDGAPHILNLSFIGRDTDYLAVLLDREGFAVSTRSACESDAEGSRVVLAYTLDEGRAASTLRISLGPRTSPRELRRFFAALRGAVAFLDAAA